MNSLIVQYQPSTDQALANSLTALQDRLRDAAVRSLEDILQGEEYTQAETDAMISVEMLKHVNGLDLAAVLLRAQAVREIERTNAMTIHPAAQGGEWRTLGDVANYAGVSLSEISRAKDLVEVVFPYVEGHLGMPVQQFWHAVGKSNMYELLPVLKAIITGEDPGRGSTRNAVRAVLDDIAATAQSSGEIVDDEGLRRRAVEHLVDQGTVLPNRELRQAVRQNGTELVFDLAQGDEFSYLIARMSREELASFRRRMQSAHFNQVNMPGDPRGNAHEVSRLQSLRFLLDDIYLDEVGVE